MEDVSLGSVNESIAHPRDVFRPALIYSAYAVIVVHNHPSGDPSPSQADHSLTRRLRGGSRAAPDQTARSCHHRCADGRTTPLFQLQGSGRVVKIHPTALVDPARPSRRGCGNWPLQLHRSRGGNRRRAPIVQSHVVIEGAVRMGADNQIGHGAIIGGLPQDLGFKQGTRSSVEIGNRNVIREYVHHSSRNGSGLSDSPRAPQLPHGRRAPWT